MHPIIEVNGLRKEYRDILGRKIVALDDMTFTIDGAGVYGFLGPNGSGKTTTIRCLLGLVRPSAGEVKVMGARLSELRTVIGDIGALVERPKFTPEMSGRLNLELLAAIDGIADARLHEVLEIVELTDRADDDVKTYSLGMQQRLAVAAAILRDPTLVILDEPSNGLDPAGIADMRRLVRRLAGEGRTVLVSSHQLAEMQHMCDELIIVKKGSVVCHGTVDEIVGRPAASRVIVHIDERDAALDALERAGFGVLPGITEDQLVVQLPAGHDSASVSRALAAAQLFPKGLRRDDLSLEDAFLAITQDQLGVADSAIEERLS